MLSLSVRSIMPEEPPTVCLCEKAVCTCYLCMQALRYARKLRSEDFLEEKHACVSVIEIPDNFRDLFYEGKFDIAHIVFHATRLFGVVSLAVAPTFIHEKEPEEDTEVRPLRINLIKTRPDILPAEVSDILLGRAQLNHR